MAGEGRRRLQGALRNVLDKKQDKPNLVPGLCGAYVNGQKTLKVAGRSDFIHVRLRGATSEVIQAFNDAVTAHWDLPILVYRDPDFPDIWKVWGRDISRYEDWGDVSYLPPHADAHSFAGGKTGADVVWVFKQQMMPLLTRPNATATMSVYVQSDYYLWDGQYHWWPGSGTADLSGYRPTGGANVRYITLYLDGSTGLLELLTGEEFSAIYPPDNPESYIPVPTPDQGIPLAGIKLLTGTNFIGWGELFDIRNIVSPLDQTGTFNQLTIYDDSVELVDAVGISFDDDLTVTVSGTIAFVNAIIPPFPEELIGVMNWDDGVPLCTGTITDWGDNLDISCSGVVLRVDAQAGGGGAVAVYDDGVFQVNAEGFDFNDNLDVTVSGLVAIIDGQAGGGGGSGLGVMVWDDGVPIGTGTIFDFGEGLDASISGSVALIDVGEAPGALIQWEFAEGTTDISRSSASWADMTDMSITMTTKGGPVEIHFSAGVGHNTNNQVGIYRLVIDGTPVGAESKIRTPTISIGPAIHLMHMAVLSAGSHTIKTQWYSAGGTLYNRAAAGNEHRQLMVKEYAVL